MKRIAIIYGLISITNIYSCPVCVDRINEKEIPFFKTGTDNQAENSATSLGGSRTSKIQAILKNLRERVTQTNVEAQ